MVPCQPHVLLRLASPKDATTAEQSMGSMCIMQQHGVCKLAVVHVALKPTSHEVTPKQCKVCCSDHRQGLIWVALLQYRSQQGLTSCTRQTHVIPDEGLCVISKTHCKGAGALPRTVVETSLSVLRSCCLKSFS